MTRAASRRGQGLRSFRWCSVCWILTLNNEYRTTICGSRAIIGTLRNWQWTSTDDTPRARHPVTPIVMGLFFAIGTAITLATGFSLLWPGSALDAMWRIKPEEHQQLLRAGLPAAVGFVGLAAIMAITSVGAFLRRRWAWWLAMIIFIINGIGDVVRGIFGAPAEGVIGVAVVAIVLWWLTRPPVRGLFHR